MTRICIVRHKYYPRAVPTRRNAETLVSHGYEVDVVCLRGKGQKSREVVRGVTVHRLPVEHHRRGILRYALEYGAFFFLAFWKLTWLSLKRRYRVIEVNNMPDFLVFTTLFPKLMGTKVVFQVLDHTPLVFTEHFMTSPDHVVARLLRMVERTSARWADHVLGTQIFNKQILEKSGIPSSKISVVLNVPEENVFHHLSSLSTDNGNFRLITHGSLLERYGVQTLIKAVPLLTEEIPGLEVKVVGEGEYQPQLEKLAQSLGIANYIDFTGWVPFEEVPSHITQAHIGIVTILTEKNPMLPNKLFEYLASGKPVVVAATPIIKAYFDGDSVMFYEPDNEYDLARCILELYRNPEKRAALTASGAACYEKYRWNTMKYEYIKVFGQLIKPGVNRLEEKDKDAQS